MTFNTPTFWYKKKGVIATLLRPVAAIYQIVHDILQSRQSPQKVNVPVICVGNAVAGGSGKTPTVIALTNLIKQHELAKNPHILTRGYGRNNKVVTLVTKADQLFEVTGDEAPLLSTAAPVVISADRAKGAQYAIDNSADIIIMDDGFFNKNIVQDIKILVVDRQMDFGNGLTLPAGPLREPLSKILPKTNAVITIGDKFAANMPVFETSIQPMAKPDPDKNYVGFAGIGFPDKFKNTLIDENYNLIGWHAFPDHYEYSDRDLDQLFAEAKERNATLITTEKDHLRLPQDAKDIIEKLPITLHIHDEDALSAFLKEQIKVMS